MPAALPASAGVKNDPNNTYPSNPSAGRGIIFDPMSGPKNSPNDTDSAGNCSTGALSTGIGFGDRPIISPSPYSWLTTAQYIGARGFIDDQTPGTRSPNQGGTQNAQMSVLMYIGGGRSLASGVSNPLAAGIMLLHAGNGGSRDAGAGPIFQGFGMKMVTATGAVANGAVIETGFVNRSGVALTTGQSVHGSAVAASGVIS